MLTKFKVVLVALTALLAPFLLNINSASAAYPTSPNVYYYGDSICSPACDISFYPGEFDLYSSNGRDHLAFGRSGNFAGYDSSGIMWFQSGTTSTGSELRLQMDGNVVVYDNGPQHNWVGQRALWASGTFSSIDHHIYRITMGGDGHFSIWYREIDANGNITPNYIRWKSFGNGA